MNTYYTVDTLKSTVPYRGKNISRIVQVETRLGSRDPELVLYSTNF